MKLSELLENIDVLDIKGVTDMNISGITFNSKEVKPGYLFVCIKGFTTDGHSFARNAIDLALGRGGDQAVINENGEYKFYGGRSTEIEKRTRVKARVMATALEKLIDQCENVIIMGHANPDADAIGAFLQNELKLSSKNFSAL